MEQDEMITEVDVEEREDERVAFTERERAHLEFLRWLYESGRLEP